MENLKDKNINRGAIIINFLIIIAAILILTHFFISYVLKVPGNFYDFVEKPQNGKQISNEEKNLDLLPDLAAYPARDIKLQKAGLNVFLRFTTIYYNQGEGVLELRADPQTAGIRENISRKVFQRVYLSDGTYREKNAGTFLWHQPHLHYHFSDFVIYNFEAIEINNSNPSISKKATFCVRDISSVEVPNKTKDAKYFVCGKELQGLSIGWADTYFSTYPDQLINITGYSSGKYRLSFIVNPNKNLEEIRFDNNISSVLIDIDMDKFTVLSVDEKPKDAPLVKHIYPEQVFTD